MNLHAIDWGIMGALMAVVVVMAWGTRRYTGTVANFLADMAYAWLDKRIQYD